MIYIITGNGKGKTTSALGLALRARSHGCKVCWCYFHKDVKRWSREDKMLEQIGVDVKHICKFHPAFPGTKTPPDYDMRIGLAEVKRILQNNYDLVILDEVLISIRDGFITENDLLAAIMNRNTTMTLVITGRSKKDNISALESIADISSHIVNIKHADKLCQIGIHY